MDPVITLLFSLLLAHLLADFVLQSDRDVAEKSNAGIFAKHIAFVAVLSWALAGDWRNWLIPLVIGSTHALFDVAKLWGLRRGWCASRLFVWDQAAHVAVILGLTGWYASGGAFENVLDQTLGDTFTQLLLLACGLIVTVRVGGLVIGMASSGLLAQIQIDPGENRATQYADELREGLRDGGRVIGQLERALIFFFVLIGRPEAVAFLVAAKSVFRVGELTKHSRKEAEYILIGTLMSFGWGLSIAWLTGYLLERLMHS